jgi:hypothetical protein
VLHQRYSYITHNFEHNAHAYSKDFFPSKPYLQICFSPCYCDDLRMRIQAHRRVHAMFMGLFLRKCVPEVQDCRHHVFLCTDVELLQRMYHDHDDSLRHACLTALNLSILQQSFKTWRGHKRIVHKHAHVFQHFAFISCKVRRCRA